MNKFAKYIPEADKKKQREHIGAIGAGDVPAIKSPTYIRWDGEWSSNPDKFLMGPDSGICKVSDMIVDDYHELIGKTMVYIHDDTQYEVLLDESMYTSDLYGNQIGYRFYYSFSDGTNGCTAGITMLTEDCDCDGVPLSAGLYFDFNNSLNYYVSALEWGNTEVPDPSYWSSMGLNKVLTITEKLDPPDGFCLTWNGDTTGLEGGVEYTQGEAWWKISDYVPSVDEIMGWTFEHSISDYDTSGVAMEDGWRLQTVTEDLLDKTLNGDVIEMVVVCVSQSSNSAWAVIYEDNSYGSKGIYVKGTPSSNSMTDSGYVRRIGNATSTQVITDINDPDTPITFSELLTMIKAGAYVKMYISELPDGPPFTVVAQLISFNSGMITFFAPDFWLYVNIYPDGTIETYFD